MNEVIELLNSHRSIRKFSDTPIAADLLETLVSAGQMASTSSYIQAVTVIQVRDAQKRSAFAELAGGQRYIESAAEFLVFCADLRRNCDHASHYTEIDEALDYSWTEQFLAATVDVALFAQNTVIAAESEGLGGCYIGGIRNDPERVTELLALPELVYPVFGLCLGYPAQDPKPKPRLPLHAVLHQDRYQIDEAQQLRVNEYDTIVKQYYEQRTGGKLSVTWSEQMAKQARTQKRPFIRKYLEKQGFMKK